MLTSAYDWANPPIVTLQWHAQSGQAAQTHASDTYMDLSCLVQGPPCIYQTSTHGPTYDKTALEIEPGTLVKVYPFVGATFDWDALLSTSADEST